MATSLAATLAVKFPDGLPPWVDPFLKAVRRIDTVEQRERDDALIASAVQPKASKKTKKARKKTKSRKSKASVPEEDDDGENDEAGMEDDVTEEDLIKTALDLLENAIELCDGQEALPFTWMSICHTKNEETTQARECASRAAAIEPFSPTMLFRLSEAYGREKQYVQAQLHFERGLALLPVPERQPYIAKLARIREQAEDEKSRVYKEDPFDKFPLEVIIQIMQHGLLSDRNFVIKASHVNRRWRKVLVNSCSELWKTLTFSHSGFKTKGWEEKTEAWVTRAGTIDTMAFVDTTVTSADRVGKKQGKYLADARTVDIEVRDMEALTRLAMSLAPFGRNIEHLRIRSNSNSARGGPPISTIGCGLLPDVESIQGIQSIELKNIAFDTANQFRHRRLNFALFNPVSAVDDYSALKRLTIHNCSFDNTYIPSVPRPPPSYQTDTLHNTLRGCPHLEHLEIRYCAISWIDQSLYQPGQGKRIAMPELKVAVLPVPKIWCVDILAPELEHLGFVIPANGFSTWKYENLHPEDQHPMVPTLEDSPVAADGLLKIQSFEVACYTRDGISQLEEWAPRMDNVTRFGLRNFGRVFPNKAQTEDTTDDRISTLVVRVLSDNLNWFPKMTKLVLEACLTPGTDLVELVRKRKGGSGCSSLQRITLKTCSKLSDNAKAILQQEVPFFVIEGEADGWMYPGVHFVDEDIEMEAGNDGKQV